MSTEDPTLSSPVRIDPGQSFEGEGVEIRHGDVLHLHSGDYLYEEEPGAGIRPLRLEITAVREVKIIDGMAMLHVEGRQLTRTGELPRHRTVAVYLHALRGALGPQNRARKAESTNESVTYDPPSRSVGQEPPNRRTW